MGWVMREPQMAGPPGESNPHEPPRGQCPRCRSQNVVHLAIGLPMDPDAIHGTPHWVRWVGCVHPGYTRECADCALTWTPEQ